MLDKLSVDAADRVMAALPQTSPSAPPRSSPRTDPRASRRARRCAPRLLARLRPQLRDVRRRRRRGAPAESANPGGGRLTRRRARRRGGALEPEYDANGDRTAPEGKGHVDMRAAGVPAIVGTTTDLGTARTDPVRHRKSGPVPLELTTAGQSRVVVITCEPDALDPPSCEVVRLDDTANKTWRAGEALELRVFCRDRFGNAVTPPDAATSSGAALTRSTTEARGGAAAASPTAAKPPRARRPAAKQADAADALVVVADGEGPGAVEADVGPDEAKPHAPWCVARFRADEAGAYTLRVFAAESQRRWWGGLARDVLPGAPRPCRWRRRRPTARSARCGSPAPRAPRRHAGGDGRAG